MDRRIITIGIWVGLLISTMASASDAIYVAYDADGTPHFATQPYDDSYSLYLQGPAVPPRPNDKATKSSLSDRRTAIAPHIQHAAQQHGMDPALISAVTEVESGFNTQAVSPKGAIGLMQLIPKTAADYGVTNSRDVQQNLDGGTRYLKDLLAAHNGNLPLALAAYNAGQTNVARHHQRIPPFNETMLYVPRVLAKMADYQRDHETRIQ